MWNVRCPNNPKDKVHVEKRARERIIRPLRNYHIYLNEQEVKEKIIFILKTSNSKKKMPYDYGSTIPKYKFFELLPDTALEVFFVILEYEDENVREIKTILLPPSKKNLQTLLDQKEKRAIKIKNKKKYDYKIDH